MPKLETTCRYCAAPISLSLDLTLEEALKTRFCDFRCREAYHAMQREVNDQAMLDPYAYRPDTLNL